MSYKLDDAIEHYGVKGMKWGVRKTKETVSSAKRERSWRNKNQSKMSTNQLKKQVNRLQNENDLQRLSKSLDKEYKLKAAKKTASLKLKEAKQLRKTGSNYKKQYRTRDKLTDVQLKKKVERLRLEDRFTQLSKNASKGQKEVIDNVLKQVGQLPLTEGYKQTVGLAQMLNEVY